MGSIRVTNSGPTIRLNRNRTLSVQAVGPVLRVTSPSEVLRISRLRTIRLDATSEVVRVSKQGRVRIALNSIVQSRFRTAFEIENPSASEKRYWFRTYFPTKIAAIHALLRGSASPSISFNVRFDTDGSAFGTALLTGGRTVTSTTTMTLFAPDVALIPAGQIVWIETTAQLGTVEELVVTMDLTP